jgi:hypothetical protein
MVSNKREEMKKTPHLLIEKWSLNRVNDHPNGE